MVYPTLAIPAQRSRGRRAAPPAEPLGSLTQRDAQPRQTCAACESERVTSIAMALTDGSAVQFVSCHRCEHRTWSQDGAVLGVDLVLDKARKPR